MTAIIKEQPYSFLKFRFLKYTSGNESYITMLYQAVVVAVFLFLNKHLLRRMG